MVKTNSIQGVLFTKLRDKAIRGVDLLFLLPLGVQVLLMFFVTLLPLKNRGWIGKSEKLGVSPKKKVEIDCF